MDETAWVSLRSCAQSEGAGLWVHTPHSSTHTKFYGAGSSDWVRSGVEGAEAWLEDRIHSGCALLHHKKGKGLQADHHRKQQEAHLSLERCQLPTPMLPDNSQAPSGHSQTQRRPMVQ